MSNGLDIAEDQFMKLPIKQQNLILLRNAIHNRKEGKNDRITKIVVFIWLFALSVFTGLKKYLPI